MFTRLEVDSTKEFESSLTLRKVGISLIFQFIPLSFDSFWFHSGQGFIQGEHENHSNEH